MTEKGEHGRFRKGKHYSPATEFKKGQKPWNDGLKGLRIAGSEKGWFKPGNVSPRYREIGSTRTSKDGYIEVKVERNKWRFEHLVKWEEANGPLPKGMMVIHLDQDRANNSLDNLYMISRGVNAIMCHEKLYSTDRELTLLGIRVAELKSAIKQKQKKEKKKT